MGEAIIMYGNIANNKLKDKAILYDYRRKMVEYYFSGHSYRETAREFGTSKNTVMKWVNRYKESGLEGLKDKKRAPKRVWNKTKKEVEENIIALREQSHFGARRLKEEFGLEVSSGTIYRILKEAGLIKTRKK